MMKLQLLLSAAMAASGALAGTHSEPQRDGLATSYEVLASYSFSKGVPATDEKGMDNYEPDPRARSLQGGSGSSGDPFQDGMIAGKEEAEQQWISMGSQCSNAWSSFESEINKAVRRNGWHRRGGNWRETAFNRGAKGGAEATVKKYEKECLYDSSEECVDLGDAAASEIAFSFCGIFGIHGRVNYKKICRGVAIDQCKGNISNRIRSTSGCKLPNTGRLKKLQKKCTSTIDELLSYDTEDEPKPEEPKPKESKPERPVVVHEDEHEDVHGDVHNDDHDDDDHDVHDDDDDDDHARRRD